ncbi:MAG: 5-formyltetrahydrofolate cyclo-ligase [Thermoguttaceae bacterium]
MLTFSETDVLTRAKKGLRKEMRDRLQKMVGRSEKSEVIWQHLVHLPCFQSAVSNQTPVLFYLDCKDEVETTRFLTGETLIGEIQPNGMQPDVCENRQILGFPVTIPFCEQDKLQLFRFDSLRELEPNRWGILEPKPEYRHVLERRIDPGELGFIIIPGLAFDRKGNRLGRGKGFYDRFLFSVPRTIKRVALAFDVQVIEEVPTSSEDEPVDWIITESGFFQPHCRSLSL